MCRFIAIISLITAIFGTVIVGGGEPVYGFEPIIVDNQDSIGPLLGPNKIEKTGTWTLKDGSQLIPPQTPCEKTDYLEASTTDGIVDTLTWVPDLPVSGFYEVSVCWIEGERYWRTKRAKYEITYINKEGVVDSATVVRNQYYPLRNGEYVSLGTFYFNAGTGGSVKITDEGADTQIIIADSVRFTPLDSPSLIPTDITMDTEEGVLTGKWTSRNGGWLNETYYGYNYLEAHTDDGVTDKALWTPYLPVTGFYNIYAWWPIGIPSLRTNNATYIISDWYGESEFIVDTESGGGEWVSIGSGEFIEGQDQWHGSVITTDNEGGEYTTDPAEPYIIVADAVQFKLDCAVVVAPENGYAPSVNIGTAYNTDYTVNTPYTATLIGEGCVGLTPDWTWTSDDPAIAIVDSNGLVSGVKEGRTMISAHTTAAGREIGGAHEVTVMRLLVDKAWLDKQTGPNLIVIHAYGDTKLPGIPPTSTIPNAIPFNIYTLNKQSQTPCSNPNINFVMKDEIGLKGALGDRGISKDSNVVVYDSSTGSFGRGNLASYVLWVLEMMGHDITKLYLLNGQFKQWIADGGVAGKPGTPTPITYDPKNEQTFNSSLNTTGCFIKQHLTDPNHVWLATIPPAEFAGHHIPCAVQIDFEANLITPGTTGDWRFKTPSALEAIYITQNDVTRDKYISTY